MYDNVPPNNTSDKKCAQLTILDTAVTITNTAAKEYIYILYFFNFGIKSASIANTKIFAALAV